MWHWLIGIALGVVATVITMKQIQHTNAPPSYSRNEPTRNNSHESRQERNTTNAPTSYSRNQPTVNNSHESRQRTNTTAERQPIFMQDPNDNCGVCLFKMDITSVVYLNCGHCVHEECAKPIKECPLCRKNPNDLCTVCLEKMDITSVVYFDCGHCVHKECAKQIKECFLCRKRV